jgi:uncharacterized membrane protein YqiK
MFRDKTDFEILEGFLSELLKENVTILEILESESNPNQKDDKFNRVDGLIRDGLDEWVYLFKNNQIEDDFKAKGIQKAKEKLAVAKLGKRKRTAYDQYLRNLHDEASWNAHQHFKNETVWKFKLDKAVADAEAIAETKAKKAAADAEAKAKKAVADAEAIAEVKAKKAVADAEVKAKKAVADAEAKAKKAVADAEAKTKMEAQLEIATNLLKNGVAIELVAVATGLSIETIQEIKV